MCAGCLPIAPAIAVATASRSAPTKGSTILGPPILRSASLAPSAASAAPTCGRILTGSGNLSPRWVIGEGGPSERPLYSSVRQAPKRNPRLGLGPGSFSTSERSTVYRFIKDLNVDRECLKSLHGCFSAILDYTLPQSSLPGSPHGLNGRQGAQAQLMQTMSWTLILVLSISFHRGACANESTD